MDFYKKCFFGFVLALSTLISFNTAQAAQCVSKEDMNQIAAHFTQFKNIAGKEYCYDGSDVAYLIEGLMFMRQTQFANIMPKSVDELFTGAFSSSWWNYFIGRIDKMNIQKNCPKGAAAFVMAFGGKTMYVCPLMLTTSFTALDRASIFMHEARHIDGYPHTTCTHGPRKGIQGACDSAIAARGSYAVTVETYAQMGKYALDLHPALKAYARTSAIIYADEAFEKLVQIDRTKQFVVLTKDLNFHAIDVAGKVSVSQLGQAPVLGQMIVRASQYLIFPDDKTLPAGFVFINNEGGLEQTPGTDAVAYNAMTPAQKAELVGIHYAGAWGGRVYKNRISYSCDPGGAAAVEMPMTGGTPVSLIYPNGYSREALNAHVMMDSGLVYEFGCKNKSPYWTQVSLQFDQVYKRIYKSGNVILGLTFGGSLFKIQSGTSTLVNTPFDGQIHELVPNEVYGFFEDVK